jgi:hypothetical protein
MRTIEWTTLDRSTWIDGEWSSEPDKVQWPDLATGLPCLAVRHARYGFWCGYVGVPPTHPLHGRHYDEPNVDVHGGLTFSDACQLGEEEGRGICHIDEEEPNVWWFGFDCGHAWDISPQDATRAEKEGGIWALVDDDESCYRTLEYVKQQCSKLALQLRRMK